MVRPWSWLAICRLGHGPPPPRDLSTPATEERIGGRVQEGPCLRTGEGGHDGQGLTGRPEARGGRPHPRPWARLSPTTAGASKGKADLEGHPAPSRAHGGHCPATSHLACVLGCCLWLGPPDPTALTADCPASRHSAELPAPDSQAPRPRPHGWWLAADRAGSGSVPTTVQPRVHLGRASLPVEPSDPRVAVWL